ncbi:MAG: 1-acyl-sn-glycerol-3-phosphate acyltransferase [Firmicutes bacterium]|nr:1-acyl-sn-glycerol-3-phosphate acyltransferase [Bacillota bacterium]MCM1401456.1 1-acyl-sn-glycerol-3-phosphate acyltransferase [Bacteroides sp.]MCM1476814.1 1-acyl-sn-glycerol-3-phosphate acyltransferase [Bacteroides sp.]
MPADLIEINLSQVISSRLPRYSRFIPRCVVRWLERVICQAQLNEMLRVNRGKRDAEFCRGVLEHLGITYSVAGEELMPESGRAVFVCNHPLGGLDGMMLIDFLSRRYGSGMKFIVNDLLMAIEPLRGVFLPVNKLGKQSRESLREIDKAFESDAPVMIFPAGLVSRKGKGGVIADLEWQKMFVNKAIASHRDIIPMHFSGHNSKFFYNFAKLRTQLGIPLNIEMVRLPAEVFRCCGKHFSINVGNAVKWQNLKGGPMAAKEALAIREICYSLGS